jgi:hypothetical protein
MKGNSPGSVSEMYSGGISSAAEDSGILSKPSPNLTGADVEAAAEADFMMRPALLGPGRIWRWCASVRRGRILTERVDGWRGADLWMSCSESLLSRFSFSCWYEGRPGAVVGRCLLLSSMVTRRAIGRVLESTGPEATRLKLRFVSVGAVGMRALSERDREARRGAGGDLSGSESWGVGGEEVLDLDEEPLERRT